MGNRSKITGSSTADGDTAKVELEAMRKDDFSWHPCKVSLCTSGAGLMVEYSNDNSDLDDIILSTEEAVARLRIRSTPLEDVACSIIQEGDRVLAKKDHVNLFFDAEVIKVLHIRHSKKTRCRCTFMVKWLNNSIEGETESIPSTALMKMSSKSIHVHPIIFSFFNMLSTSSCYSVSPLQTVTEGVDCEMDISQLEKQIEQISNSADPSRTKITEELLSEEADVQDHSKCNAISAPEVCDIYIQLPAFPGCIIGSGRQAHCNIPMKKEVEHSSSASSFTQEVFSGSRSPCNPIAACAALASLISKSSEGTEILPAHKHDVKGYVPPPNIRSNPIAVKLLNGSSRQTLSFINNSSKINHEYPLGKEAATTFVPKYESIVKELFPTKKPIKEPRRRSSAMKSSGENLEPPLSRSRRLTRSAVREIKDEQIGVGKNATKEILSNTSEQKLSVLKRDLLPDKDTAAPFMDKKSDSTISDKFKNQMDKSSIYEKNVSELRTSGRGMQALNNARRLTRSAVNAKTRKNNEEPQKGSEECSFSEHNKTDWEENITSAVKAPDMEKSIRYSPADEICPNPIAEAYKKVQLFASIKTAHKTEDEGTSNGTKCSQGIKRKSITSKTQELRSSPRLRSLHTRCQTKS